MKADLKKIEEAVTLAERNTAGEIVPMIVARSSTIGHVFPLLTALLMVFSLVLGDLFHWTVTSVCLSSGGAVLLGWVLSQIVIFQRLLTPAADQIDQVALRAEVEFYQNGLNQTKGKTGILIFVSMMERRAVVLADQAISSKLSQDTWNDVISRLLSGLGRGDLTGGFSDAIARCGEILATHFPPLVQNSNELSNRPVVKE